MMGTWGPPGLRELGYLFFSGRRPKVVDPFCTSVTQVSNASNNNKHNKWVLAQLCQLAFISVIVDRQEGGRQQKEGSRKQQEGAGSRQQQEGGRKQEAAESKLQQAAVPGRSNLKKP